MKPWKEINIEQLRTLVESMPERIFEVNKLNGAKINFFFSLALLYFF